MYIIKPIIKATHYKLFLLRYILFSVDFDTNNSSNSAATAYKSNMSASGDNLAAASSVKLGSSNSSHHSSRNNLNSSGNNSTNNLTTTTPMKLSTSAHGSSSSGLNLTPAVTSAAKKTPTSATATAPAGDDFFKTFGVLMDRWVCGWMVTKAVLR